MGVAGIAQAVRTRPCVYAVKGQGGTLDLRDRRVYADAYARAKQWICGVLSKGTTRGIVMGQETGLWEKVVAAVGRGMVLETDGEEVERPSGTVRAKTVAGTRGDGGSREGTVGQGTAAGHATGAVRAEAAARQTAGSSQGGARRVVQAVAVPAQRQPTAISAGTGGDAPGAEKRRVRAGPGEARYHQQTINATLLKVSKKMKHEHFA